ncbi:MAG: cytochrome c [Acidobacteriota bacterium]
MTLRVALAGLIVAGVAGMAVAGHPQTAAPGAVRSLLAPSLEGRDIYRFFCASCHGLEGRGDGSVAVALQIRPPDLTRLATRNDGRFPRERLRDFVTNGPGTPAAHGTGEMPVWGPTFRSLEPSDQVVAARIANVIAYLESIQVK